MLRYLVGCSLFLSFAVSVVTATNAGAVSPHLVVSALQTRSHDSAYDELITVHNTASTAVDITNWCVKYSSANSESFSRTICFTPAETGLEHRILINAGADLFIASTVYAADNPDFVDHYEFAGGMSDTGGRVAIFDNDGTFVDAVAWGTSSQTAEGGVAALAISNVTPTQQLQRIVQEDGSLQDTDVNGDDFILATAPATYEFTPLVEVLDYCLNLAYSQLTVPAGMQRDTSTGECALSEEDSDDPPSIPDTAVNTCEGLVVSEIGANLDDQFIEIYNILDTPIELTGCKLMTNRSTQKAYTFGAGSLVAHSYRVIAISDTDLTLTKTTTGTVYIVSSDDVEQYSAAYKNLHAETSWSWFGGDDWRQTYALTPGTDNRYQEYPACESGYERNLETGRCNKVEVAATSTLQPCAPGQYRNPTTNRCRNADAASGLTPCAPGQYRNPATNRCKAIASATGTSLKPCAANQERNPDTNRCRAKQDQIPDAPYGVEPTKEGAKSFTGWALFAGVATLGVGYGVWEWRQEIMRVLRKSKAS